MTTKVQTEKKRHLDLILSLKVTSCINDTMAVAGAALNMRRLYRMSHGTAKRLSPVIQRMLTHMRISEWRVFLLSDVSRLVMKECGST